MLLRNEIMTNERGRTRSKHVAVMYSYHRLVRNAERKRQRWVSRPSWEAGRRTL